MSKKMLLVVLALMIAAFVFSAPAWSNDDEREEQKAKMLTDALATMYEKSPDVIIEEIITAKRPKAALPAEKKAIKAINVVGATVIDAADIENIVAPYRNQSLTGEQMQQCADAITALYEKKGYIASYAYIIPEKVSEGILQIMVQEITIGDIEIKGNQYFSNRVIEKKLGIRKGEVFNKKKIQVDIYRVNRHPDRKVHFLIKQGKEPGTVDIALLVKDKWPFHTVFEVDNYGSEAILRKRYKTYVSYNNLTGHDDSLTVKYQRTDAEAHELFDFDYYIPLNDKWKLQLYWMPKKVEDYYYSDNEWKDFEKHARKWYFFFYQSLIEEPGCDLVSSYGFVYKDIHWKQYDQFRAWDRFRALMWSLDYIKKDKMGTTVVMNDLEIGIPGMLDGNDYEDEACSVTGAGGGYKKNMLTVARSQKLFAGIEMLNKARWQLSSHAQPGVNVFSVGGYMGVIDMRGYPRAQAPGDRGYAYTGGFSFPAYFVPRSIPVPFSKAKLYDSLKFFTFFDWATAILKNPGEGGDKSTTLSSAGWGLTFSLPENFSARLDMGWPLRETRGKDGDHCHIWFRVTKGY